ncbi:hypothetical protein L195_g049637, partial [Trifolium pratense]
MTHPWLRNATSEEIEVPLKDGRRGSLKQWRIVGGGSRLPALG